MRKAFKFTVYFLFFLSAGSLAQLPKSFAIPKDCQDWFKKSKIIPGKSCVMDCALLQSGMATFDCSRFCEEFCLHNQKKEVFDFGFKISAVYPGLTDEERRFVEKHPQEALQAYWLSWRAESVCKTVYLVSNTNDESDACRHFVWAALLNAKFGQTFSSELLDAHEQNPAETQAERSMDLANNRRGLIASTELIKNRKNQESDFLKQFIEDLKTGKIIVLKGRRIEK